MFHATVMAFDGFGCSPSITGHCVFKRTTLDETGEFVSDTWLVVNGISFRLAPEDTTSICPVCVDFNTPQIQVCSPTTVGAMYLFTRTLPQALVHREPSHWYVAKGYVPFIQNMF